VLLHCFADLPALQPLPEDQRQHTSTAAVAPTPTPTPTPATSSQQQHAQKQQQQQHKEDSRRKAWQAAQQAQDDMFVGSGAEGEPPAQHVQQPGSNLAGTSQQRLAALDEGRRRALEAYQSALDKQAAEFREKQLQLEQERRAQVQTPPSSTVTTEDTTTNNCHILQQHSAAGTCHDLNCHLQPVVVGLGCDLGCGQHEDATTLSTQ
jgi:hypothetical protein